MASGLLLAGLWRLAVYGSVSASRLEDSLRELLGEPPGSQILALALLSGFAEEVFFRGAVQGAVGLPWTVCLFAMLHSGPGRIFLWWTAFAALAGLALGGLMLWRQNLLSPVAAHVTVNLLGLWRLVHTDPKNEDIS